MHKKFLYLLILIGVAMRLLIIISSREIVKLPDSELYLSIAAGYYHGHFLPNLVRLPGYPFFIYIIFLIFGWGKLKIVYFVQHALTLISCVLIYKIIDKRVKNQFITSVLGLFIFINYNIVQWGQILMPEALSVFLISLLFYLNFIPSTTAPNSPIPLISLFSLLLLGFIKPLYLSFSFAYVFYLFLSKKVSLKKSLLFFSLTAVLCLSYTFWNYKSHGFFGISNSDSTTVFGKIVNFRLEACGSSNDDFSNKLNNYLAAGGKRDWYQFVYSFKKEGWGENLSTFQKTYVFNSRAVLNCPFQYFSRSLNSFPLTLFSFDDYLNSPNPYIILLKKIYPVNLLIFTIFLFFMLSRVPSISHLPSISQISLILLFFLFNLLSIYLFAADSFSRLRAPFEITLYLFLIPFFRMRSASGKTFPKSH